MVDLATRLARVRLAIRLQSEGLARQSVHAREVILDTHSDAKAAVQGTQFHSATDHRTVGFTETNATEHEGPYSSFRDQIALREQCPSTCEVWPLPERLPLSADRKPGLTHVDEDAARDRWELLVRDFGRDAAGDIPAEILRGELATPACVTSPSRMASRRVSIAPPVR